MDLKLPIEALDGIDHETLEAFFLIGDWREQENLSSEIRAVFRHRDKKQKREAIVRRETENGDYPARMADAIVELAHDRKLFVWDLIKALKDPGFLIKQGQAATDSLQVEMFANDRKRNIAIARGISQIIKSTVRVIEDTHCFEKRSELAEMITEYGKVLAVILERMHTNGTPSKEVLESLNHLKENIEGINALREILLRFGYSSREEDRKTGT
jgi:hypothetical protein